jgi:hypothetical protein
MRKTLRTGILNSFIFSSLFLTWFATSVSAQVTDEDAPPLRLQSAETIFINVLIAIWSLSIPYFIFVIIQIGFEWMTSAGDEQKMASLKTRGKNVFFSFGLVFGGYLGVKLLMSLLGLKSPETSGGKCFTSPLDDNAIFQFFFPEACSS